MKRFLQSRTMFVAGAIGVACAVLPGVIEWPKVDRFFSPGVVGEEKAESRKQKAEIGSQHSALNTHLGFATRSMYGGRGENAREWERRNGIGSRIDFSHNLSAIFPPSEYLWHPEFFPLLEGERLQPSRGSYFWQPDLGREDVAAWAADAARRHFQVHPDAVSFAVGVNDGLIFGESEETMALVRARGGESVRGDAAGSETVAAEPRGEAVPPSPEAELRRAGKRSSGEAVAAKPGGEMVAAESRYHGVTESPVRWFRQRPDFTDLVYTFTNRVAREVATTCPDKYVGALAYYWCENAPSFPLEPNVIPFLTADRSQGYDEQFRLEERELQRKWSRVHGKGESVENSRKLKAETLKPDEPVEKEANRRRAEVDPKAAQERWTDGGRKTDDRDAVRAAIGTVPQAHVVTMSRGSGRPRRLGLYDYLYGSGFLIPRMNTRLIADNLRQARRLGFTDYFAELNPNWGLDGPMAWMVAQLLQDPEQSREVLLEEYYSRYFREAAVPMRRFFERCEYQWMTQPGPAYWLKHYRNESQARLFPSGVCRELRALLDEAARQARDEITKKRVAFVSDAFGVTERFVEFCEAREELNRAILKRANDGVRAPKELSARFLETRAEFVTYTMALTEREPQALSPFVWADYLRHEPPLLRSDDSRNAESGKQKAESRNGETVIFGKSEILTGSRKEKSGGRETDLVAKAMATVVADTGASQPQAFNLPASRRVKPLTEFRDLTFEPIMPAWSVGGLRYGVALPEGWQSYVEPSEFQSAELRDGVLRLTGNKETFVYQWVPASGDAAYLVRVRVRGRVQSSTTVILALSWLDSQQRRIGSKVHRLPEGEWPEWVKLEAQDVAPAGTAWVGVGLRVQNQMNADWIEARDFTLDRR